MNKKDLKQLKQFEIIEIEWDDAPNELGILLEKPEMCKGDVSLKIMFSSGINSHATHTQIVKSHGMFKFPTI